MHRILNMCLTFIGGTLGWYAGAPLGTSTAVILSFVGTGAGFWAARRIIRELGV